MGWYHWDGDGDGGGSGVNNTTTYTYDSLSRLTKSTMASHYTQNYNYDRYGNMVCSGNYCNITVAFDPATNRITTLGFTYDAAGNLTQDGTGLGTHTFQWDAEGRMVSVDGQAGQACQTSWTDCFTYNALGQRVQKHVGSPASYTYYYYDASGKLAMTKGASQVNEYLFPGNFGKYYWTGSAWETDYTHKNLVGSTQVVTRANGSYAQAQNFYSFGGVRWSAGGTQDVRFASMQERDVETQGWQDPLDPTPNRTYTSGLGRWFSPDPLAGDITNPQSLNRYAYALNNPTTLNDPLGLQTMCPNGSSPSGQGQCVGFAQNGLGVAFPPMSGEYSCSVDSVETNCGPLLDQISHGSTTLMFEALVGQAIANSKVMGWGAGRTQGEGVKDAVFYFDPETGERVDIGGGETTTNYGADFVQYTINVNPPTDFEGTLVGATFTLTYDRYHNWYVGAGYNVGRGPTAVSLSATPGWVLGQPATRQTLNGLLTGGSLTVGGSTPAFAGAFTTTNASGTAFMAGGATPQVGFSYTQSTTASNLWNWLRLVFSD